MKLPATVRNVTVHLWSIWKVDIENRFWEKKTVNYLFIWLIWKLWKPLKCSSVNQHLPSAPHDWNKQKENKLKYNSAAIWTILNLMSYLKIYLQIAEISGNKHIGYFYEKENFMADTIMKLRYNWTRLTLRCLFPWLDLPYCKNWARNKPTTTASHVKHSWKTFLCEMDWTHPPQTFRSD